MLAVIPIEVGGCGYREEGHQPDRERERMAPQQTAAPFIFALGILPRLLIVVHRRQIDDAALRGRLAARLRLPRRHARADKLSSGVDR